MKATYSLVHYFIDGFTFARDKRNVFLVASGIPYFFQLLLDTSIKDFFPFVFFMMLVSMIIPFIIPVLLAHKNAPFPLTFRVFWSTAFGFKRRLILPGLFLYFLMGLVYIVLVFVILRIDSATFVVWNKTYGKYVGIFTFALFNFTELFFALENKSVFISFWQNIVVSLRHFRFVLLALVPNIMLLPLVDLQIDHHFLIEFIAYAIISVVLFWKTCAIYLYFNANIRKK